MPSGRDHTADPPQRKRFAFPDRHDRSSTTAFPVASDADTLSYATHLRHGLPMNLRTQRTSSQRDEGHLLGPSPTQVGPVALRQGSPVLIHCLCAAQKGTGGYP